MNKTKRRVLKRIQRRDARYMAVSREIYQKIISFRNKLSAVKYLMNKYDTSAPEATRFYLCIMKHNAPPGVDYDFIHGQEWRKSRPPRRRPTRRPTTIDPSPVLLDF